MTITITGTAVDGTTKYTFTGTSLSKAKKEWTKFRDKQKAKGIIIPTALDIVYSGYLVLIYPEWQYPGYSNAPLPGSGGIKSENGGTDRSYVITVTSDEYKYSIINNNYVVVLGKSSYKPVVTSSLSAFYIAKVGYVERSDISSGAFYQSLANYMLYREDANKIYAVTASPNHNYDTDTTFQLEKICNIYNNTGYTIALIMNHLASLSQKYSFTINSATSFTFHFSMNGKPTFIPIIFTKTPKYANVFTPKYFDGKLSYYRYALKSYNNTWSQTIDLNKPYTEDKVVMNYSVYYDRNKWYTTSVFVPSEDPVDISRLKIEGDTQTTTKSSNIFAIIIWIIVAIIAFVFILIIVVSLLSRDAPKQPEAHKKVNKQHNKPHNKVNKQH